MVQKMEKMGSDHFFCIAAGNLSRPQNAKKVV
jgi:hypothetical protein